MSPQNSDAPASPSSAPSMPGKPPRLALLIATGFGLGYLPKAPGTWGSILGVSLIVLCAWPYMPLGGALSFLSFRDAELMFWELLLLALLGVIGVWSSGRAARHYDQKDPQQVVIDEVSGVAVCIILGAGIGVLAPAENPAGLRLAGIPISIWRDLNWKYLLAGFVLFRVFDIWKPWPARAAEKLPGGWGIMADDWVAGIYAALCLWGLRALGM